MWQFFYFDFSTMSVWRGVTSIREGYRTDDDESILLPVLERHPDFIRDLKIGSRNILLYCTC